jgi:hypothetical protein
MANIAYKCPSLERSSTARHLRIMSRSQKATPTVPPSDWRRRRRGVSVHPAKLPAGCSQVVVRSLSRRSIFAARIAAIRREILDTVGQCSTPDCQILSSRTLVEASGRIHNHAPGCIQNGCSAVSASSIARTSRSFCIVPPSAQSTRGLAVHRRRPTTGSHANLLSAHNHCLKSSPHEYRLSAFDHPRETSRKMAVVEATEMRYSCGVSVRHVPSPQAKGPFRL